MSSNEKKAVVVGPYRVHNFGDDLVGAIIAKRLQKEGYKVTVPLLDKQNSAWLGTEYAETYDGTIEDADTVVVGGGGIMSDTSGAKPGASYLDIVARRAIAGKLKNKKIVVTSVGAGPWILERSKMLAYGISMIADKIGVRDEESFKHLDGIGVKGDKVVLGADCALLSSDYLEFSPQKNDKIGIQFDTKQFESLQDNASVKAIARAIKNYANQNSANVMLVSNRHNKSSLANDAPDCETLAYEGLEHFLPKLAGLKAMFTSHLHLAITAYSQRIPTFSLYAREKTKRFYNQIGHPERAIDLGEATLADFERFMDAAENAVWTEEDEKTLQSLQAKARSLMDLLS